METEENRILSKGSVYGVYNGSNELVGLVEVRAGGKQISYAKLKDRIDAQFWEELEDRADRDPSPPENAFLSLYLSDEMQYLTNLVIYRIGEILAGGE